MIEHILTSYQIADNLSSLNNTLRQTQEALANANRIIEYQNTVISSFGVIYTAITIAIAGLAIAIPFWVKKAAINPSKKQIEEFKENLPDMLNKHIVDAFQQRIDKAIEGALSNDLVQQKNAANTLYRLSHEVFPDSTIIKLISIFNSQEKKLIKDIIFQILVKQDSKVVDLFFEGLLASNKSQYLEDIIEYMTLHGIENYTDSIITALNNSATRSVGAQWYLYNGIMRMLKISQQAALSFSNNNAVLKLNIGDQKETLSNLKKRFADSGKDDEFENSLLYKHLSKLL